MIIELPSAQVQLNLPTKSELGNMHSHHIQPYMNENAKDAYWPNLVSVFRVTYLAYCEFLSDLFGKNFVHIIDSPIH